MPDIVVIADTSCLIALSKIGLPEILHSLYTDVRITRKIADELGKDVPEWITITNPKENNLQLVLERFLYPGEASAIALGFEFDNVLLVLDDLKGRKEAARIGFRVTGTLGILLKAKTIGIISAVKPFVEKLKVVGFRISEKVETEFLKESGE